MARHQDGPTIIVLPLGEMRFPGSIQVGDSPCVVIGATCRADHDGSRGAAEHGHDQEEGGLMARPPTVNYDSLDVQRIAEDDGTFKLVLEWDSHLGYVWNKITIKFGSLDAAEHFCQLIMGTIRKGRAEGYGGPQKEEVSR